MAKSQSRRSRLSVSRDIPFNKLVLSQANVRRIKAGVSIEELAEDIARRTLLQSLTVRPVLDASGAETGMFEVPAGGRRYRALELLVKQKRLRRDRADPLHRARPAASPRRTSWPRTCSARRCIPSTSSAPSRRCARRGRPRRRSPPPSSCRRHVVSQRLRLAAVSPKLLEVYAEDGMTLDQLMAFTVTPDHERQEQVWEALQRSYNKEPYQIRRLLTEDAVRASDKRAQFVGIEAYEAAGGIVLRDLFEADDGGWLQDPALLDRLVAEKLEREAEAVRAEGWKWVEVAPDFPYGHTYGLRRLSGTEVADDRGGDGCAAMRFEAEYDKLEETYAEADELPEEVDQRLGEIETALAAFDERPVVYDPAEIARAGAFVSIDSAGDLRIERGYVRPEDEAPVASSDDEDGGLETANGDGGAGLRRRLNAPSSFRRRPAAPMPTAMRRTRASGRSPTG